MKKLLILIMLLVIILAHLNAQESSPRSYPALNAPESELAREFASTFEEQNVGNMHVYATMEDEAEYEYFFRGNQVGKNFVPLFRGKWRGAARDNRTSLHAVYTIRGGEDAHYIMRFSHPRRGQRIELFNIENGRVEHVKTLASMQCKGNRCYQLDTWIRDIDGDTRLDLIQKTRVLDAANGVTLSENAAVYAKRPNGVFEQTDNLDVDLTTLNMMDLVTGETRLTNEQ